MVEDIHRIGLGTVQLGLDYGVSNKIGRPDRQEITKIFRQAKHLNIDLLDTASAYGESEQIVGENHNNDFKVISKWLENPDEIYSSLEKLCISQLYGWLAHRPMSLLENRNLWNYMQEIKLTGKAVKIGYSLNYPEELDQLLENGIIPDIVQFPCNILDGRFLKWINPLKDLECEIHCRSIYLQGLFFMEPNTLDPFFHPIKRWLRELHNDNPDRISLLSTLIKTVLGISGIDRIILGIDNHQQLVELQKALEVPPKKSRTIPEFSEKVIDPSKWPQRK